MPLLNTAGAVYVGATKATAVYAGSTKVWNSDPLAGVSIGDPFMGGYYAGIIDTTKGNIISTDASQTGQRYALIVSPASLQLTPGQWRTSTGSAPAATHTRWDGLTATAAMASTTYPAANYCHGLTYPADGGSAWYLPAMDELEIIYRNLKATTESNAANDWASDAGSFPYNGGFVDLGYNPSSDPAGSGYTTTNPAQTSVAAFRDGGGQDLGDAFANVYFWSSTEYNTTYVFGQSQSGSVAGYQNKLNKGSSMPTRPVRRLVLS